MHLKGKKNFFYKKNVRFKKYLSQFTAFLFTIDSYIVSTLPFFAIYV